MVSSLMARLNDPPAASLDSIEACKLSPRTSLPLADVNSKTPIHQTEPRDSKVRETACILQEISTEESPESTLLKLFAYRTSKSQTRQ